MRNVKVSHKNGQLIIRTKIEKDEAINPRELQIFQTKLIRGLLRPVVEKNNQIQILVSTTVVEVGVDVKNATMMIIFNAERFGLATLHQLRGRVGRNDLQSYCVLISGTKNPETKRRLEVITKTTDGFKVAEEDLKLRGPGDFFGYRQSGLPMLKMADMMTDIKLLELAKKAAAEILSDDPKLDKTENAALSKNIQKLLEEAAV